MNRHPKSAEAWRKAGLYLPEFMRDFHDQKDLFKTIAEIYQGQGDEQYQVDWAKAHVYTVDRFLWFMATHGYTLQRTRTKLSGLCDLERSLADARERRMKQFAEMFANRNPTPQKGAANDGE